MAEETTMLQSMLDIYPHPAAIVGLSGEIVLRNEMFSSCDGSSPLPYAISQLQMEAASYGKSLDWTDLSMKAKEKDGYTVNVVLGKNRDNIFKLRIGHFLEGEKSYFLMCLSDITQQWMLEKKVATKDSLVERVISEFPVVICGMDNQGVIQVWNHRATELFGYNALEMVNQPNSLKLLFPNDRQRYEILNKWNSREENVIRHWNMEMTCKDGSVKTISWTVRYRENSIMAGIHHWALGVDISTEIKALRALRQSEERFQIIAKATNDAVWDYDLVHNSLWWGNGLKDLFGYDPEKIDNTIHWWEDRLHPDFRETVARRLQDFIKRGEPYWSDEYLFRKSNGDYAYVFDKGHLIKDESGTPIRFIGGMSDLSDEKAFETLAKMREEQLRNYLESGADKLRPPLSRILHIAKLLTMAKHDRPEVKELAEQLLRSTHELEMAIASQESSQ